MFTNIIEGLLDEIDEKLMHHVCNARFEYQKPIGLLLCTHFIKKWLDLQFCNPNI